MKWRPIIARAPLPALALAAAHGVYSFNLLFVPTWVALISAAAFELTYVGLAVSEIAAASRRRASIIATSAVGVSIAYNTLAGLFHRRPDLLLAPALWLDVALSVLHGLPLAIVAYNVAQLMLHAEPAPTPNYAWARPTEPAQVPIFVEMSVQTEGITTQSAQTASANPARDRQCRHCGQAGLTAIEVARHGRARKRNGACPAN